MGPSEAEIEARLAELRRRREAIDREIADLLLYLELGRRLAGGAAPGGPRTGAGSGSADAGGPAFPAPTPAAAPAPAQSLAMPLAMPLAEPSAGPGPPPAGAAGPARRGASGGGTADAIRAREPEPVPAPGPCVPPPVAFADDPVGARRYGRALVEAACAVIAQAGHPLHVGAILPHLLARGFVLPGRDPAAALNTRLWKRSGPGGPLVRMGDATYALAPEGAPPGEA